MSPAKARQEDEETVQVPTTEPPHGATSGQDGPAPPVPPAPPPSEPELAQADAKVTTMAKSPTPRNPTSACLMGGAPLNCPQVAICLPKRRASCGRPAAGP